jgi:hypothetical protein
MHERILNMEYISRLVYWHIMLMHSLSLSLATSSLYQYIAESGGRRRQYFPWRLPHVRARSNIYPRHPPTCLRCTDTYKYIITHTKHSTLAVSAARPAGACNPQIMKPALSKYAERVKRGVFSPFYLGLSILVCIYFND